MQARPQCEGRNCRSVYVCGRRLQAARPVTARREPAASNGPAASAPSSSCTPSRQRWGGPGGDPSTSVPRPPFPHQSWPPQLAAACTAWTGVRCDDLPGLCRERLGERDHTVSCGTLPWLGAQREHRRARDERDCPLPRGRQLCPAGGCPCRQKPRGPKAGAGRRISWWRRPPSAVGAPCRSLLLSRSGVPLHNYVGGIRSLVPSVVPHLSPGGPAPGPRESAPCLGGVAVCRTTTRGVTNNVA